MDDLTSNRYFTLASDGKKASFDMSALWGTWRNEEEQQFSPLLPFCWGLLEPPPPLLLGLHGVTLSVTVDWLHSQLSPHLLIPSPVVQFEHPLFRVSSAAITVIT